MVTALGPGLLAALVFFFLVQSEAVISNIGINYGQLADNLPAPQRVVQLVRSTVIRKLKIYDTNPMLLGAFGSSGVEFVVGVKNEEIRSLLDSQVALKWVSENVALYMKTSPIGIICVGNQLLTNDSTVGLRTQVVMVMRNLHAALEDLKLDGRVRVSTPLSMAVITTSFPPSAGEFDPRLVKPIMLPLLRFLNETGSPFMVNIYPYFSYRARPMDISLAYALFLPNKGVTDKTSKLHYENLFDAQLDAVYAAIGKLGFSSIPVVVSETGWPSSGSPGELGANVSNAMTYNRNLVKHIQSGAGTPMKPKQIPTTYIFSLFDENLKQGPTSQRHFGLFQPRDLSAVYDIGILQGHQPSPPPLIPRPPPPFALIRRPPPPPTTPRPPPPLIIPIPRPPPPVIIPIRRPPPPPPKARPLPPPPLVLHPPPPPPGCSCEEQAPPPPPPPPPASSPPPPKITCPPARPSFPPPPKTHRAPPPPAHSSPPPPLVVYPSPSPPPAISTPPSPYLPGSPPPTTPGGGGGSTHVYCVAKPGSDTAALIVALNFACGEGGADCSAIQSGGSCFSPDTVSAHASYAFNSYYQKHGRNYWNCYFDGNALVTVSDPSFGTCTYPDQ